MKHPHAELIHAWAEGADIQIKTLLEGWQDTKSPIWGTDTEYRIKPKQPKQPEWFENIPKHGVLCWVSDTRSNPSSDTALSIITTHKSENFEDLFGAEWAYATPLTDAEIKQLLRGEQ